jgi:hypothetical protein
MGRRATITSARRIERERRTAAIMQMRLEGHSLRAIGEAQRPPVSGVAIFKTIRKVIDRMATEATEQARRLEALRLDELTVGVYPAASAGDLAAIDTMLHIMRRRARLLGLDTPVRWAPGVGSSDSDPPTVHVEILGQRERAARIAVLEAALEGRDPPPGTTSLTGLAVLN